MRIIMYRALQFEQSQIVFESGCVVLSMNNHSAHIFRDRPLTFQLSGNVKLPKNSNQRRQKSTNHQKLQTNIKSN